jgi:PA14 domain/Chitobiase/beta-hexosaminidase C-terminal domain/Glycosyl hydrolases family 2, TIM barrel domain/Glycosyl hydrolases family 2, sugar binding domain/Glycosyl hydrolases family 2
MKKLFTLLFLSGLILSPQCTRNKEITWKIMDNPILTQWASKVDPAKPWPQYPRPDMVRTNWINLNGLWDYAVTPKDVRPEKWDGKILVPYPVESALSGVKRRISETESLWYKTSVSIPNRWRKGNLLLNFEASDWETKVWVDGKEAGIHKGGYDPFTFEISALLKEGKDHEILICVWDPTSNGRQPRGKQVTNPGGIYYTPSTGLWQTVWLEPVNNSHISSFRMVPDIDAGTMSFTVNASGKTDSEVNIKILDGGKIIATGAGKPGSEIKLKIEKPVLWSPENPHLYEVTISLKDGNTVTDKISSIAGMRKISIGKTEDGFTRMLLNNKFVYQNGPLDQGFWPDGLYTPPTDEAMVYDLKMTKEMGFNMLRKHVKVENRRFYNWCDKMGILVWQDMPSGDASIRGDMPDIDKDPAAAEQFRTELKNMIDTKYNHPSIIMWVPFNEGWGQFQTEKISAEIKAYDPTRLVNNASGWTDRGAGDLMDVHNYPLPACPPAEEKRAIVNGEFGGLGFPVQNHLWEKANWGYRTFEDTVQLLSAYGTFYDMVYRFVKQNGLSATVYTQTTDVETETNGLMTYDRKICKMGVANIARANMGITPPVMENTIPVFSGEFTMVLLNHDNAAKIYYTTDGTEPTGNSAVYTVPVKITGSCTLKTFAQHEKGKSSTVSYKLIKKDISPATANHRFRHGLKVNIYEGQFTSLPDFSKLTPLKSAESTNVSPGVTDLTQNFALTFEGYILIPEDGIFGLSINSDDGSKMILDEKDVINNDGVHTRSIDKGDYYALGKGYHKLHIEYFQETSRRPSLRLTVEVPGKRRTEVPAEWLYR